MPDNRIDIAVTARDEASRTLRQINGEAQTLGNTLGSVGKIAAGFLAANVISRGFGALTSGISSSIKAASDLNESINAANQIFGRSAEVVTNWSKTTAASFGLSERAANQSLVPIGAMLQNLGLAQDDAAATSVNLAKRAADMASVFNTDVDQALTAIAAALRGEADPIERFGVSVKETNVQLKALAMTGKDSASELTNSEKAAARLALIFEQTSSVAGDFVNTSNQVANAARVQAAEQENAAASIGQSLLPAQLAWTKAKREFVALLANQVIPAVTAFARQHLPAIKAAMEDVRNAVQTAWPTISKVIDFVVEHIGTRVAGMIDQIKAIVAVVKGVVETIKAIARGDWSAAWDAMKGVVNDFGRAVVGALQGTLGKGLEIAVNLIIEAINKVRGPINSILSIGNKLGLGLGQIGEAGKVDLSNAFEGLFKNLDVAGERARAAATDVDEFDASLLDFSGAMDGASKKTEEAGNRVKSLLERLVDAFKDSEQAAKDLVRALVEQARASLRAAVSQLSEPTQEMADIQLRIAQLEERRSRRLFAGKDPEQDKVLQQIEQELDILYRRMAVEEAVVRTMEAKIQAEDKSLLTEQERADLAGRLLALTKEQSEEQRKLIDEGILPLFPALEDAKKAFDDMRTGSMFMLDEKFRDSAILMFTATENMGNALDTLAEKTREAADKIVETFRSIGERFLQKEFQGSLEAGAEMLPPQGYTNKTASGGPAGPGYQTGTPYVPRTGMYMLHKGEAVIPAADNSSGGIHIGQIVLPGVTNPREFMRELSEMQRQKLMGLGLR